MTLYALAFYVFSAVTLASACMVITVRNPVHAVLFLVLTFFSSAGLFLLAGAEFLAFVLVIVYVGAVAVLFLFVVMMLDVDVAQMRRGVLRYLPVGALVGAVLLAELVLALGAWSMRPEAQMAALAAAPPAEMVDNTTALGRVLYTRFIYPFQAAGMVLFVAMVGAIVLTLRHRPGVRRQDPRTQIARDPEAAVDLKDIAPGRGI